MNASQSTNTPWKRGGLVWIFFFSRRVEEDKISNHEIFSGNPETIASIGGEGLGIAIVKAKVSQSVGLERVSALFKAWKAAKVGL